jgi:hypothetical protein
MSDRSTGFAPPHAQLIQTGTAFSASQMLLVAAQLELADRLGDRSKTSDELANELGMNAPAFYRFLRSLAGMGVLTEVDSRTFALTPRCQHRRSRADLILAGLSAAIEVCAFSLLCIESGRGQRVRGRLGRAGPGECEDMPQPDPQRTGRGDAERREDVTE